MIGHSTLLVRSAKPTGSRIRPQLTKAAMEEGYLYMLYEVRPLENPNRNTKVKYMGTSLVTNESHTT